MQRGRPFQDPSISNFIFIIRPTESHFSHPTQTKRTLTLQKGMQTLGTLQECIPLISKERGMGLKHRFHPEEHSITFRVINDKNLNYQWTVYDVLDGGELEEIDCMQFSIQGFWKGFIGEYEKNVANLSLRIKDEKDPKKMLEIWKQILGESKERSKHMRVTFVKAEFSLDFHIETRSDLDKQLEEYETEKVMRKLREAEKSQIRKSAITLSNMGHGQDDFTNEELRIIQKMRRGKTEEGDRLGIPTNLSPSKKFLLPIKQLNEPIKNTHSHSDSVHKARFSEEGQQSLEISDLINSVKKSNSFEKRESMKENEREQNLQLSSKIKHEKSKAPTYEISKKQDLQIHNIKMTIIYIIMGIVMLWLLYHLMGHDSRVEYKKK